MYYIMTHPSMWGMGSDSDTFLAKEENLKRFIKEELRKKSNGEHYSEPYTGSWEYKDVLGKDADKVYEEIINARRNTCTTYGGCNDLIAVPEDVPVIKTEECLQDTIFRIFNQFGFQRDIIVHNARFVRYVLDLEKYEGMAGLKGARYFEFTGFDFQGILMNHFLGDMDREETVLKTNGYSIQRLSKKLTGEKVEKEGYIDDFIDMDDNSIKRMIENHEKIAVHLKEKVPEMPDDYYEHLYLADYDGYYKDVFRESIEKDMENHTEYIYRTILGSTFACIYSGYDESSLPHRYDELFKGECNLEHLLCIYTGAGGTNHFGRINVQEALRSVFGYD